MHHSTSSRLTRGVIVFGPIALVPIVVAYAFMTGHVESIGSIEYHFRTSAVVGLLISLALVCFPLHRAYVRRQSAEEAARSFREKLDLETKLAQTRELYFTIVEQSHDFMWVADPQGVIVFANAAGSGRCSVGKTTIRQLIRGARVPDVEQQFAALSRGEKVELDVEMLNGTETRVLEVTAVQLTDGNSLWTGRDVTASRNDSKRIRELESRLKAMLDSAVVFAVMVDIEGRIEFVNDHLLKVTEYSAQEVVGKKWREVFLRPGMSGYDLTATVENALPTAEYEIRTRSGRLRRVRWSRTRFRDWTGRVIGVGSMGEDVTARQLTARALLDSEKRFRGIFEQSVLGMVLSDERFRAVECNSAFRAMFGLSDDHGLSSAAADAVLGPTPGLITGLRSLWNGEQTQIALESAFERKDGDRRWCRVTSTLLRDAAGEGSLAVSVFEDITEVRRHIAELAESREKFRRLVELTTDFIWRIDATGTYTYASPQVEGILGYAPEEIVGRTPAALMIPSEAERLEPVIADHLAHPRAITMLLNACRHRDGRTVLLETSATPAFDGDGSFAGYHGIDRDVTDREHARRDLTRLATAIAAAGDAVIITDVNGVIEYVNPKFEQLTGYKSAEAVGLTPRVLKSGRQPAEVYERLWRDLSAGNSWSGRFVNRRKDGSFYDADVKISPIIDDAGIRTGFVAVQRDMTEHIALLGRLQRAQELERLGRLVGGVAHEVRNPLNAIQAAAATLELDYGSVPGNQELFAVVRSQVDRLTKLMRDLLEMGKPVTERRLMSAGNVCAEALAVWRGSHPADADRIEERVDRSADLQISVDSVRMQQVIINLLDNAVQNSPERSPIVLGCDRQFGEVRIYVEDFGSGIKAEISEKIFEPFFTTRRRGTGLGLSLVKNIVERHEGQVVLRNRAEGSGAIAEVLLPASQVTAEAKG